MSATPLALVEGEIVPIDLLLGDLADANQREAFRRSVAVLGARLKVELGLREDAVAVVETSSGSYLRTRGVSGTITLGRRTLDIRPKHVEDPDDPTWQTVLTLMIERSERRRAAYFRSRRLHFRARTFIDQLGMGLAMELDDALRHPEVRAYRSSREELSQLRGRLLITEQLRSSLLKPHKVICEVDELSADNPVNRLLHWAAGQLGALATQGSVRRALSVQAARLPSVTHPVKAPTHLSFQLPRQYQHYAGAVELATAFARGLTAVRGASDVGGAGFVVGTERLFESFVERSLFAALDDFGDWTVAAQERAAFAKPATDERAGRRAYFSKPDNVVRRSGDPVLLVDAKYKRFSDETDDTASDRPGNGDLYQMAAACVAHNCRRALLLYPRLSGHDLGPDWYPIWWQVDVGPIHLKIGAVTVPLALLAGDAGLATFDRRLREMVTRAASAPAGVRAEW